MRLISQLIKNIAKVLPKLLNNFNGTVISISFVPSGVVTFVIFSSNLNEALLLLPTWKFFIGPSSVKAGSSL